MIIDSHAHYDPRILDREQIVKKMDDAGVDRIALIPTMNDPLPASPELLLALYRHLMNSKLRFLAEKMHRHFLNDEGNLLYKGKEYQIYPYPDNEPVVELVKAHPDKFFGWIFLNPKQNKEVLDELEKWRMVPGMIGVKLHPHWHDYKTEILGPILQRCQEVRLPVLIHLGFGQCGDYKALAESYPNLNIICAHAGFPFYKEMWSFGQQHKNLYVDLSSPYISESLARSAVKKLGAEKCLYGTDSPYGFHEADLTYDYHMIKNWMTNLPISEQDRDKIFHENFLALCQSNV